MSNTTEPPPTPPARRLFGNRRKERRDILFSSLHPIYRSLRDKSNVLTADEALCEEQKDIVKALDLQIKKTFDPRKPHEDPQTRKLRHKRAIAMEKIKTSKLNRSKLIIELSQAQQVWDMVHKPSQEEQEELGDRLEQEYQLYWKALKIEQSIAGRGPASRESKEFIDLGKALAGLAPPSQEEDEDNEENQTNASEENPTSTQPSESTSNNDDETSSIESMDIASLSASGGEYATAPEDLPLSELEAEPSSSATSENESSDRSDSTVTGAPATSLDSVFKKAGEMFRTSQDSVSSVLKSVGNLRQRRKKSD